jgi:hypothetical protein
MTHDRVSVSEAAERALVRIAEASQARSVELTGDLTILDCEVGSSCRASVAGTDDTVEVVITVESITSSVTNVSGLREPFVDATATVQVTGGAMRVAVFGVRSAPAYSRVD